MITETETASAAATASSAEILRDTYARWREVKYRHAGLLQTLEESEQLTRALRTELAGLQKKREEISFTDGYTVGNQNLKIVDAERGAMEGRKVAAEDTRRNARIEFERAEVDLAVACQAAEIARQKFCFELAAPMEAKLRDDKQLRKRLVEAFAAIVAYVDPELPTPGRPNWFWFLLELFPEPDDAELTEPVARLVRDRIAPLVEAK